MSKEEFKDVKAGQAITAGRANREGAVLSRFAKMVPGSGMSGRHSSTNVQFGGRPRWNQGIVTITGVATDVDDPPIYIGVRRGYSFAETSWIDQTKEWWVDAKGLDLELEVGDRLVAYWDAQRSMLIPMTVPIPDGPFVVTVVKDGGVAGSPDTTVPLATGENCSWTYEVYDLNSVLLAVYVTPERARHPKAVYLEAGAGGRSDYAMAYWIERDESSGSNSESSSGSSSEDDYGNLILMSLEGEILDSGTC